MLAVISAGALGLPGLGNCEKAMAGREVEVNGSGFLLLQGNRMSPPWILTLSDGRLAVNDSAVAFPAERPKEESLFRMAQWAADSMRMSNTPAAKGALLLVDIYRSNGHRVTASVKSEQAVVPSRPPRTMGFKVVTLTLADGRTRRFYLEGAVVNALDVRDIEYWGHFTRLAQSLRNGSGVIVNNLETYTIVPRDKVKDVNRAIEQYRAGLATDPTTMKSLSRIEWSQIRSPARLQRVFIGERVH
jgi:hypothetical protein